MKFNHTESHFLQIAAERVKIMIRIFILKELLWIFREDEGDEKHVESFVSFSDDEGEKEKKEKEIKV